jgi:hypothetical protein
MAEAAQAARKAFGTIGAGAGEMSGSVGKAGLDVRHSLGLVDNVIRGAHAQAMADLIRMYAQSAVVMTALPIAATVAGFALLGGIVYEVFHKIHEYREEQEKLADDMTKFKTVANNALGGLGDRILEAEKRSDELRNDHLGALRKELELIDHASMGELVKELETVAKAADVVFAELKGHWYTFGSGSEGAQHALQQFQTQYDNLLSMGKDKEAGDLLHGTLSSAKEILKLQKDVTNNPTGGMFGATQGDAAARYAAQAKLRAASVGYTKDEVSAQQQLVDALSAQVDIEGKVAELKKDEQGNAKRSTGNEASAMQSAGARAAADSQLRMGQSAIAGEKAAADAKATIARASISERLQIDLDFAAREYAVQEAANQQQIAALDKSGKDYSNQLKALKDKALELTQQHETSVAEITSRAAVESAQKSLRDLETSEREKIDATQQGSAARLAAVNAALKEEESLNLQDTSRYRELLTQRSEITRQMTEEQAKLTAEAGKEAAANDQKLGELQIAAERDTWNRQLEILRSSSAAKAAEEEREENQSYALKLRAYEQEKAAVDSSSKDYLNKLQQLNDKEEQLTQEHLQRVKSLHEQAAEDLQNVENSGMNTFVNSSSQGLTKVIMGHESLAKAAAQTANSVISSMAQMGIKYVEQMLAQKLAAAMGGGASAAASTAAIPIIGPALAPAAGAAMMAEIIALETGGIVPGVGRGDIVPAMLTPGEAVLPKSLTEGLTTAARSGHMGGGSTYHVHVRPTYHVNTIDGDGMADVLDKHSDKLQKHFEHAVRKMNR